ncbi:MAG: hypothetical protein E7231_16640 [Cellulosilyticum sp.]|jgi:hypothetical protein|nr:hypothetical protein [Cellulosilyticum sp.]
MLGATTMAKLSKKQIKRNENAALQVIATLGIEDMHVSQSARRNLLMVARGEKTSDELLTELRVKYAR